MPDRPVTPTAVHRDDRVVDGAGDLGGFQAAGEQRPQLQVSRVQTLDGPVRSYGSPQLIEQAMSCQTSYC